MEIETRIFTVFVLLVLFIYLLVFYYTGIPGAVVFSIALSVIVAHITQYIFLWGKQNGQLFAWRTFFLPMLLSLVGMLYLGFGFYHLALYARTGVLNQLYFYTWLALTIIVPAVYFGPSILRKHLTAIEMAKHYLNILVSVSHRNELPILIKEIRFVCTANKRQTSLPLINKYADEHHPILPLFESREKQIREPANYPVSLRTNIPVKSDRLFVSWYSFAENCSYTAELPIAVDLIPYRLIRLNELYQDLPAFAPSRKQADRIHLQIRPEGCVCLFDNKSLLQTGTGTPHLATSTQVSHDTEILLKKYNLDGQESKFIAAIQQLHDSGRFRRLSVLYNISPRWSMTIHGVDESACFDVRSVTFGEERYSLDELASSVSRPLPRFVEFLYPEDDHVATWLKIFIDTNALLQAIYPAEDYHTVLDINLSISILNYNPDSVKLQITRHGNTYDFSEFIVEIIPHRVEGAIASATLHKKQRETFQLLNSAWDDARSQNYTSAVNRLNTLLSTAPDETQIYFLQAYLALKMNGVDSYLSHYESFIQNAASDNRILARIYNLTGCALDEKHQYEQALAYFIKAYEIDPKVNIYLSNIAELYYKLDNPDKAKAYAKMAVEQGSDTDIVSKILKNHGIKPTAN